MGDLDTGQRFRRRHQRAAALMAVAGLAIVAAGGAYLKSTAPISRSVGPPPNPLLSTSYLITYDFATPSLGWAAMSLTAPSSTGGGFEVFQTVDGARHWRPQLQSQASFSGLVPFAVQLFDTKYGFMTIGSPVQLLYRSTDAGNHWDLLSLPSSPRIDDVAFSDASHGWVLASLNLYSTADAGTTWQRLPDPPGDASTLSFRGPSEAWLGSAGPGRPHVYTSRDASESWQRHDLPRPSVGSWDATAGPFQVASELLPMDGVIMSATCICEASGHFEFTSFDEGSTWRFVEVPKGNVAYQDGVHWWAIDGTVLSKSSDAGLTWSRVTDKLPDWHYLPHVLDANHAWADLADADGGGLGLSSDGGLHWTRGTVPQPAQ